MKKHGIEMWLLTAVAAVGVGVGCGPSHDRPQTVENAPVVGAGAPATPLLPPGHAKLLMRVSAKGDQIYAPKAAEGGKFEWGAATPDAKLFDEKGNEVGTHGKGPHWTLADGGTVVGQLPPAKKVTVDPKAVPWLEINAKDGSAAGSLKDVTIIQRVKTSGGLPPAEPPASGDAKPVRVPYTTEYVFYTRG